MPIGIASSGMNLQVSRAELERRAAENERLLRQCAKTEQSRRGWYDEHGVRQGGLIAFIRYFWPILEPETPLVDGWVLWAICEHLEAVTFGDITRLLINVFPGAMKSLTTDVFWPAWEWGPCGLTHNRYVAFSYSASLTERDNDRFRALISHASYQRLYGPLGTSRVKVTDKSIGPVVELRNKTITKVMNTATGWKLASSVGGVGTGERGDRIIIDDPHNVVEGESEQIRNETVRWFRESVSSRFNNLDSGAMVVIMQRVHEDDVSGTILTLGTDYCHLMIPWNFDPDRCIPTSIGWVDPRYDEDDLNACDGAPAWPERFSDSAIERLKIEIGPYGWAGQYQQAPTPRGGGIFQRAWWQPWQSGDNRFPVFDYIIASLDTAVTENEENDPCALTVWGVFTHPETKLRGIMLVDAWRKWLKIHGTPTPRTESETIRIGDTSEVRRQKDLAWKNRVCDEWGLVEWTVWSCRRFKVDKLLIETQARGIDLAAEIQRLHAFEDWSVQLCPAKGDKYARALAVQPTFAQLKVWAPLRDWAEMVIDEMCTFPKSKHDDLTDSATQAIKYLRENGLAKTDLEQQEAQLSNVRHRGQVKALYPA